MRAATIISLKTLIAVLLALLLICQVWFVPVYAAQVAGMNPEADFLMIPGDVIAVIFLACMQVVLICVWRLLSLVRESSIFSEAAFAWVDVILGAVVLATVLILGSLIGLIALGMVPPAAFILGVLGTIIGSGLALLVVVMRGLLHSALRLEQDLAEVV
ncbi:MAG: DUF2975 domain-containing protein [Lacisediminihabitans sp.]